MLSISFTKHYGWGERHRATASSIGIWTSSARVRRVGDNRFRQYLIQMRPGSLLDPKMTLRVTSFSISSGRWLSPSLRDEVGQLDSLTIHFYPKVTDRIKRISKLKATDV